jgi:hypothetical protein
LNCVWVIPERCNVQIKTADQIDLVNTAVFDDMTLHGLNSWLKITYV